MRLGFGGRRGEGDGCSRVGVSSQGGINFVEWEASEDGMRSDRKLETSFVCSIVLS